MRYFAAILMSGAVAMLAACGGSGDRDEADAATGGPEFSVAAIEQQCVAYAADWVAANAPDAPGLAETLAIGCCPEMAAAAEPLSTQQRVYLWTDTAARLSATLPPEKVQAYRDTLPVMRERLRVDERTAALAPRSVIFEACRRGLTG